VARASVALLAVVALGIAACGGTADEEQAADARVVELRNLDQAAAAFDADKGKPRLVLLLSPT